MLDIHGRQPAQEASLEVQSSSDFLQGKLSKPCEQCGQPLKSRKHGGGSPQRFCSQECRTAWHSAQRNPACTLESAIVDPPPKKPQTDSPAATPEASEDFDWSNTTPSSLNNNRGPQSIGIRSANWSSANTTGPTRTVASSSPRPLSTNFSTS